MALGFIDEYLSLAISSTTKKLTVITQIPSAKYPTFAFLRALSG